MIRIFVLVRACRRCQACGRRTALDVHHVLKRSQGGSDFDLDWLVALCRACHERTDAAYCCGRLVITPLGNGGFVFELVWRASKWEADREIRHLLPTWAKGLIAGTPTVRLPAMGKNRGSSEQSAWSPPTRPALKPQPGKGDLDRRLRPNLKIPPRARQLDRSFRHWTAGIADGVLGIGSTRARDPPSRSARDTKFWALDDPFGSGGDLRSSPRKGRVFTSPAAPR